MDRPVQPDHEPASAAATPETNDTKSSEKKKPEPALIAPLPSLAELCLKLRLSHNPEMTDDYRHLLLKLNLQDPAVLLKCILRRVFDGHRSDIRDFGIYATASPTMLKVFIETHLQVIVRPYSPQPLRFAVVIDNRFVSPQLPTKNCMPFGMDQVVIFEDSLDGEIRQRRAEKSAMDVQDWIYNSDDEGPGSARIITEWLVNYTRERRTAKPKQMDIVPILQPDDNGVYVLIGPKPVAEEEEKGNGADEHLEIYDPAKPAKYLLLLYTPMLS